MKPTVKAFQDDIGLLNELKRQSSKGVSKDSLHVFAHDEESTDCIVGDSDAVPVDLADLVAERYNESDHELHSVFRRFGFDPDESRDLEEELESGKILLLIE
ncbi:general stress protein [Brevibacterium picturae]|uniref:General stress protein 17M-like domain-containing protein n=1 Tax=Brevibacterium picturae TaxID=260553 RepID=A0ABP4NCR5_9MICO